MFLATAALLAALATKVSEPARCPNAAAPAAAPSALAPPTGPDLDCSALSVTGVIKSDGLVLDPSFTVAQPLAELSRPQPGGRATIVAYGGDGRALFTFPFDADGQFSLTIPVDAHTLGEVRRVRLTGPNGAVERAGTRATSLDAEVVDVDPTHVLVSWNSSSYPALRVLDPRTNRLIAEGSGASTYTQFSVPTSLPSILIQFSDGAHSVSKVFRVFGR